MNLFILLDLNPFSQPNIGMANDMKSTELMEEIVGLCKRKGFVFQSSEIYGGYNGFFDYGPLGVELKKNIKDAWWQDMVHRRDDIVGLDSSIIMNPNIWRASGHVDGFTDPMIDCKESKMRYRADHLFFAEVIVNGECIGVVSVLESPEMIENANKDADRLKRKLQVQGEIQPLELICAMNATPEQYAQIPSPATGKAGTLTPPREFNMMFETNVGALRDDSSKAYLRPETAQGIFANFKNVTDTSRVKLPFGIAQIGKAFRNEITPRNFIFRSREFEQMEIEYFIHENEDWEKLHEKWIQTRIEWFASIGLTAEFLGKEVHPKDGLAHYARACTDITFKFPFGVQELEGIAARGNFDLSQHQEHSGKGLEIFDEASKTKLLPHVIEPSLGVDRTFLALICAAYTKDEVDGEERTVLKFHPRIAPIKAAVFPLVKKNDEIMAKTDAIYKKLKRYFNVFTDTSGAIGRRYRRMDEVGTPYCITVDFDSLEDGTVTIRDRDTTKQERVHMDEVLPFIMKKVYGE